MLLKIQKQWQRFIDGHATKLLHKQRIFPHLQIFTWTRWAPEKISYPKKISFSLFLIYFEIKKIAPCSIYQLQVFETKPYQTKSIFQNK